MSRYIKIEDALEAYNQAVTTLVENEMEEFDLGDFTECSFNTTQIKLIGRMIESLPTIEVSEDAISRKWVMKEMDALITDVQSQTGYTIVHGLDVKERIKNAPSVIPSRPKGEWEEFYDEDAPPTFKHKWKCSKCGASQTYGKSDFCPNCGADMRKERG